MYGWYVFNAQIIWKIVYFWWFVMIFFGTFEADIWPHILSMHPINDYFIFGTLNRVCINEKFDSMYGWYSFNAQIMWKICHFGWFLMIFGTFGGHIWPHILSRHHINDYLIFGTLNRVCTKEWFDSMYGWYAFNAQII